MLPYINNNVYIVPLWMHYHLYKLKLYILQSMSNRESSRIVTLMASNELYVGAHALRVAPSHIDPVLGHVTCIGHWDIRT